MSGLVQSGVSRRAFIRRRVQRERCNYWDALRPDDLRRPGGRAVKPSSCWRPECGAEPCAGAKRRAWRAGLTAQEPVASANAGRSPHSDDRSRHTAHSTSQEVAQKQLRLRRSTVPGARPLPGGNRPRRRMKSLAGQRRNTRLLDYGSRASTYPAADHRSVPRRRPLKNDKMDFRRGSADFAPLTNRVNQSA